MSQSFFLVIGLRVLGFTRVLGFRVQGLGPKP